MLFEDHKPSGDIEVERVGDDVVVTVCDEWTCKSYTLGPDKVRDLRKSLYPPEDREYFKNVRRIEIRVETIDDVLNVTRSYSVVEGLWNGAHIHYLLAQAYEKTLHALQKRGVIPGGEKVRSAVDVEQERDRQQLESSDPPPVAAGHLR